MKVTDTELEHFRLELERILRNVPVLNRCTNGKEASESITVKKGKSKSEAQQEKKVPPTQNKQIQQKDNKKLSNKPKNPSKKESNEESKILFNKIELDPATKKKRSRNADPKVTLDRLQKKRAKLTELEESNPLKASELVEKEAWTKAINKASGIIVHDDEKLLKKSMKRRLQKKEKSKRDWEERKKGVKNEKESKQVKRMENLEGRKKKFIKEKK